MKILFVLVFASSLAYATTPCGGVETVRWTNADSSPGGWVAKTAKAEAGAYIAPTAEVCGYAKVDSGARILGRSKVSGRAKIGKSAKVDNSIVCQASVIEGISVTDSDYYCQTEDPEPPHPGEAGKQTLLGVDSDRDGVRDDIEIWINNRYSNEPNKDNYNMRMYYKAYAVEMNSLLRPGLNKEKAIEIMKRQADYFECASMLYKSKTSSANLLQQGEGMQQLQVEFYNTLARIKADGEAEQKLHGQVFEGTGKTQSLCTFEVRK